MTKQPKTEKPVRYLKGIGPKRSEALERLGIKNVSDLLYFFPRRFEDRSTFKPIRSLRIGDFCTVKGKILTLGVRRAKNINIFEVAVDDGTGFVHAVWFNQPYLKQYFKKDDEVILSGKLDFYNRLQLNSPEYEILNGTNEDTVHTGRITPIYPLTEGLKQRPIRAAMKDLVDQCLEDEIEDFLPEYLLDRLKLDGLKAAIKNIHFPESFEALDRSRTRLIFDEFFIFETSILMRRARAKKDTSGYVIKGLADINDEFEKNLPFELTDAQKRVIDEIVADVSSGTPMIRLLQGDVGSGKTVVAAMLAFMAYRKNLQSAFMAPTEILAEQHYKTLGKLLGDLNVELRLLTKNTPMDEKKNILSELNSDCPVVVVGTHSLIQEEVNFNKLAVLVVDEQHKFGVRQRGKLLQDVIKPHVLIMTATPIPRTLGLTLYGDLDISTIDEFPYLKQEIKTYWITKKKEPEVLEFIRKKVTGGEQAYIVFPLVDETEKLDLQAATKEFERLKRGVFGDVPVGLVHGKMKKDEKDEVMSGFYSGKIKVLVATLVIEVGIDNPRASIIVIENAERFGLSQLHQMRGRVGRGAQEAFCFLFGSPKTEEGKRRLRVMTKTNDGFKIAEEDLLLRGPGDFLGTRQSGAPYFNLANLFRDHKILLKARKEAKQVLEEDPYLKEQKWGLLSKKVKKCLDEFIQ